jgi:hypothetical protein
VVKVRNPNSKTKCNSYNYYLGCGLVYDYSETNRSRRLTRICHEGLHCYDVKKPRLRGEGGSDSEDETRELAAFLGLPEMVLPQRRARVMLDLVRRGRRGLQVGHQNSGVEILAQLRDALVLDGPNMHPEDARGVGRARGRLAFHENPVPDRATARQIEGKGVTRSNTGEQAHHVLLPPWPIEPPLQILVHYLRDLCCIARR